MRSACGGRGGARRLTPACAAAAWAFVVLLAAVSLKPAAARAYSRAQGFSDPNAAELRAIERQGGLVRVSFDEKPIATCARSFVGISMDVDDVIKAATPEYMTLLRNLTAYDTGPLYIRVGALQADRLTAPWADKTLHALTSLNRWTGAKFILTANLHSEDPSITKAQVQRFQAALPPGAILSFSIGNEPNMYSLKPKNGMPGAPDPKPDNWLSTRWVPVSGNVFKRTAVAAGGRLLAGPEWAGLYLKPATLKWWLSAVGDTLNMVTMHHYSGNIFEGPSIEDLVSERQISRDMPNLNQLVKVANSYGLPLRITEAAPLSYGGVQGVSDKAGAAVWVLDTALESCYAGAAGINFHQGLREGGNANYNAVDYKLNRAWVRMPFYGMLLLQQALAGGASVVAKSLQGECKAWVLKGHKGGDLRVVVLNKINWKDCAVDVQLSPEQAARFADTALVDYLFSRDGLYETWRLYLSGLSYQTVGTGLLSSQADRVHAPKYIKRNTGGRVTGAGFAVAMLPGTKAMLITIPQRGR